MELIVSIISAMNLAPLLGGGGSSTSSKQQQHQPGSKPTCNPYAKVFLLPDRSELAKRRTATIHANNNPVWGQTFVYTNVDRTAATNTNPGSSSFGGGGVGESSRALEVTVWDLVDEGGHHSGNAFWIMSVLWE